MNSKLFTNISSRLRILSGQFHLAKQNQVAMYSNVSNAKDEVLLDAVGSARIMTLNRPKALNALNLNMVEMMIPAMQDWCSPKSNVSMILIKGAGGKAFCAGGDIKAVTEEGKKDPSSLQATYFFRREYILNDLIGSCPLPFVALIDGITMGGGVGLSVHAPFRVATEKTVFAMPETAIGLFPDVGGGHFLSRLPGAEGMYLSLTGVRLKGEDVQRAGVASHYITHENGLYESMQADLLTMKDPTRESINNLLNSYQKQCATEKPFALADNKSRIDEIFSLPTLEEIYTALEKDGSEWATKTLATLRKMSPSSMKITMEQLHRGKSLNLSECLKMELRMCRTVMLNSDFYEGVRALLVEKDNQPSWRPNKIEDVSHEMVQSYFDPMPDGAELEV